MSFFKNFFIISSGEARKKLGSFLRTTTKFQALLIILAMVGLIIPSFVFAQDQDFGLKDASKGTGLIKAGTNVSEDTIPNLIGSIVGIALSFVGAIFFLLILYAGFLWMTAFGAAEKVDKAKNILEHAAVGLVIVLAAYAISNFVFSSITGATNPPVPTGQADIGGCCYETNESGICFADFLESECDLSSGSGFSWQAGECPSYCVL